jgi:hypothetical protein
VAPLPLWRRAVDALDQQVTPRLVAVIDTEAFAIAAGLARTVQHDIVKRAERGSRYVLHVLNLPAGSDINRLLTHMASLERQFREVRLLIETAPEQRTEVGSHGAPRTRRGSRPPAP